MIYKPGKVLHRCTLSFVSGMMLLFATVCFTPANAAVFGKNKVQHRYFQWKYITTEHFDLFYNQDGKEIAAFAAEVAEDAYAKLSRSMGYDVEDPDPITLVTYQSHNDFEQTNLQEGSPSESTGGFTEFLKTRVAVPFEGDHEKFRHVIHHELTHAMFLNMLFGQGFGAVVSGISQSRIPLWFIEGLAEYESREGLDPETEMFLRDAVVNDLLPDIDHFGEYGYLGVYKCGQSVLYWIAWRYGDEKIAEILHNLKGLRDFNRALKASIGIDQKELSKRWRRFVKERYWQQVADMEPPDVAATRLTDHEEDFCYINNSPAISPNGEWIAFLSDRSDYFDVYLMSAVDGEVKRRLVHGQRTGQFEELHWLRPGITWSPDGTRIAFCAKAGRNDALYIINAESGNIEKSFSWESDALFSPSWSPANDKIALIKVLNGRSDLAVVNVNTGAIELLTHDFFDEADPSWSGDGRKLLFTSNRGDAAVDFDLPSGKTLFGARFKEFDIYEVDLESREMIRITDSHFMERTPIWIKDNIIMYVSDQSGVYNLFQLDRDSGVSHSLTNLVTGCSQPSYSVQSGAVAFASYFNNGYDVFQISNPFSEENIETALQTPAADVIHRGTGEMLETVTHKSDYSSFVFRRLDDTIEKQDIDSTEIESRRPDEEGNYPEKDYSVSLSPDLVFVSASYSPYFKMEGQGMMLFTDVLGNHQLYMSLNLNRTAETSDIYFNYRYLARRVRVSTGMYHYSYLFPGSRVWWKDRSLGLFLTTGYPLNRFNRIETGLSYLFIDRSVYHVELQGYEGSRKTTVMPHIGYVHDTSLWRSNVEPANGGRWRFDLIGSPNFMDNKSNGLNFYTLSGDWRRYFKYRKDYSFAVRFSGAVSSGKDPQRFFLGGIANWFNPIFDNPQRNVMVDRIEDVYYSSFITPLRGVGFYNRDGTRYILSNLEFRFPFIRHLVFGWPLPAYFRNVRGALFLDAGTAWQPEDIGKQLIPDKWPYGFGFGLRLDLGIFPLQWDVAWSPEPSSNLVPRYYFSINTGF